MLYLAAAAKGPSTWEGIWLQRRGLRWRCLGRGDRRPTDSPSSQPRGEDRLAPEAQNRRGDSTLVASSMEMTEGWVRRTFVRTHSRGRRKPQVMRRGPNPGPACEETKGLRWTVEGARYGGEGTKIAFALRTALARGGCGWRRSAVCQAGARSSARGRCSRSFAESNPRTTPASSAMQVRPGAPARSRRAAYACMGSQDRPGASHAAPRCRRRSSGETGRVSVTCRAM